VQPLPMCAELPHRIPIALIVQRSIKQRHHSVYETAVILGNCFLSATRSRTLAFGYRQYGRPILATAGLLDFMDYHVYNSSMIAFLSVAP